MFRSVVFLVLFFNQTTAPAPTRPDIDLLDAAKLGQLARTKQLL